MAIGFMFIPDYLGGEITELIVIILSILLIIVYNFLKKVRKSKKK